MARPKSKLNDQKSEFIEENVLKENPEGLPDETGIVLHKHIPKMERIVFLNGRDPGYPLDFHYHSKTHPLKSYTLYHGHEHDLPMEVIDHLENCAERQYGYTTGPDGHPKMYVKSLKYIFQCKRVNRDYHRNVA
jgi:hypothetical protein